nr:MAG: DUF4912 domain-containing protein [Leptolyngbya sp. IPPAS B-1204]
MHSRNILFFKLFVAALALTATPKLLAETFAIPSVLAQSPSPTSFPLPESLPEGATVKVDGSTSMTVVNEALKDRFQQRYSGSTVELAANGTDQALQALQNGDITVAAVGRPLTDAEKAQGLVEVPINRGKIAIIVGPENPFQGDITFDQFARIFRGEITDWSQLGGQPGPIRFVDRPDFSDTRKSLSNYAVFQSAPFETGPNTTQVATDETAAVIQELGRDGISYAIADQVLNQSNVKIIPMHQTLPDDPRYPFSQPRGYVYKETPDSVGQAFLGFATSAPGQEVVAAVAAGAVAGAASGAAGTASPGAVSPGAVGTASPEAASPSPATAISPSPAAVSPSPEAVAQAPAAEGTTEAGGFPWWLLAIPILGGLLWWLLRGRGGPVPTAASGPAAVPAPVAAVPPPVRVPDGRIILTPRDCRHAYAYWEVPEERKAQFREQGGRKLALRLYDVTDIDMDRQVPHSVKQFDCREADPDLHVPIAVDNRDYIAELGYVSENDRWMKIARSEPVRVPACPAPEPRPVTAVAPGIAEPKPVAPKVPEPTAKVGDTALATGAAIAGGAALAGAAIAGAARPTPPAVAPVAAPPIPTTPSRLILTARDSQDVYAYWEAPEAEKMALKQQGGEQFGLRLYDVTDHDPARPLPPVLQQFTCDETDQDRHILVPATNRDYLAEVGYTARDGRWLKLASSNTLHVPASAVGAALAGGAAAATAAIATTGAVRSIASEPRPAETDRLQPPHAAPVAQAAAPLETGRCSIKNITVHSRHNCYLLSQEQMRQLETQTAVTKVLSPGTHLVRIKSGAFGYEAGQGEPIVLLWFNGGTVVNKKTDIPVNATWSTLNGYDETLTLEVLETTTLHAFFFDTHLDDNEGEVTLSVVSLPAL